MVCYLCERHPGTRLVFWEADGCPGCSESFKRWLKERELISKSTDFFNEEEDEFCLSPEVNGNQDMNRGGERKPTCNPQFDLGCDEEGELESGLCSPKGNKEDEVEPSAKPAHLPAPAKKDTMFEIAEVKEFCDAFGISEKYRPLAEFLFCLKTLPCLDKLLREFARYPEKNWMYFHYMLGISKKKYLELAAPGNPLVEKGIMSLKDEDDNVGLTRGIASYFDHLAENGDQVVSLEDYILGEPLTARFSCEDYDFCPEFDDAKKVLESALAQKRKGVHILVCGESGTGKSELVKTLCEAAGGTLYDVAASPCGNSDCESINAVLRGLEMASKKKGAVLLVENAKSVCDADNQIFLT